MPGPKRSLKSGRVTDEEQAGQKKKRTEQGAKEAFSETIPSAKFGIPQSGAFGRTEARKDIPE